MSNLVSLRLKKHEFASILFQEQKNNDHNEKNSLIIELIINKYRRLKKNFSFNLIFHTLILQRYKLKFIQILTYF